MSIAKTQIALYPLRFEPIFQYRLWGGRRLEDLVSEPLPGDEPIGEAWILSDREDHPSRVADGPLKGKTIKDLIELAPEEMLGPLAKHVTRFPLLLKFLDASSMLSVQVHPSDKQKQFLPPGEAGKTEAWVVLMADPDSVIYAGLKPGTTPDDLRSLSSETANNHLASFQPSIGDGVYIPAGTVHALGGGVVVFEVQQNSDVTFRLYDWDRVDPQTGHSRELHVEQAIACVDFEQGEIGPVLPVVESTGPVWRDQIISCPFFEINRVVANSTFDCARAGSPIVLVCADGQGEIESGGAMHPVRKGDVYLLPAGMEACAFHPEGQVMVFEVSIP